MPWFLSSLPSVTKSLSKAAALAFSKFKLCPKTNSASNSLAIDCSKSNKPPAIPSKSPKLKPSLLAS